jgi:hypothetical protein
MGRPDRLDAPEIDADLRENSEPIDPRVRVPDDNPFEELERADAATPVDGNGSGAAIATCTVGVSAAAIPRFGRRRSISFSVRLLRQAQRRDGERSNLHAAQARDRRRRHNCACDDDRLTFDLMVFGSPSPCCAGCPFSSIRTAARERC